MENVNEGDRRFMKYSGPVYDGVEYKTPQEPDKQKMKEIKLAALESSKSLTRLLELLREYDETEPKAKKVLKPLHELPIDTEACKAVFNFVHPYSTFVEGWYKESSQFIELKGLGPESERHTVIFTKDGALLWSSNTCDAFAFVDLVRSLGYSPVAK